MAISDLSAKQGNVNIELTVVSKGDVREFEKFGKTGRVCNIEAKDETGTIKISLWNDQIDQVNAGDKIKIENGYVNEWQGELQLTTGKFGTLTVTGQADTSAAPAEPETPAEPAEPTTEPGSAVEPDVQEEKIE